MVSGAISIQNLSDNDARRAMAVTPVNLLVHIAIFPVYFLLFRGSGLLELLAADRIGTGLVTRYSFVVLPHAVALAP